MINTFGNSYYAINHHKKIRNFFNRVILYVRGKLTYLTKIQDTLNVSKNV